MDSQTLRRPLFALALLATLFALTAPAQAAFPGKNGRIAIDGIFTFNADGSEVTFLASGYDPAWSPDGKQIAFITGTSDVYVMDQNGLNQRQVTNNSAADRDPAWSPDGQKIVFANYVANYGATGATTDLYVVRMDGTGQTNLTNTPSVSEVEPAWSADGKIAFVSENNIFVMNGDGTGRTQLTDYPPGSYRAAGPNWSPDGEKLLYARDSPDYFPGPYDDGLQVINADGSGDITIRRGEKHLPMAAWSPDGRYIVFDVPTFDFHLYEVRTTRVTGIPRGKPELGELRGFPDWQPIPGPKRSDYKNSRQFCRADRAFLGEVEFRTKYGTKSGANAFGKCVARG